MAIFTIIDLKAYKQKLQRQQECLKLSLVFTEEEKIQVQQCYNDLIEICENKLINSAIVIDPIML